MVSGIGTSWQLRQPAVCVSSIRKPCNSGSAWSSRGQLLGGSRGDGYLCECQKVCPLSLHVHASFPLLTYFSQHLSPE